MKWSVSWMQKSHQQTSRQESLLSKTQKQSFERKSRMEVFKDRSLLLTLQNSYTVVYRPNVVILWRHRDILHLSGFSYIKQSFCWNLCSFWCQKPNSKQCCYIGLLDCETLMIRARMRKTCPKNGLVSNYKAVHSCWFAYWDCETNVSWVSLVLIRFKLSTLINALRSHRALSISLRVWSVN